MSDDTMALRWYAVPNDLIGGWSVVTADIAALSELDYEQHDDHREPACFLDESTPRHIAALHNCWLEQRQREAL